MVQKGEKMKDKLSHEKYEAKKKEILTDPNPISLTPEEFAKEEGFKGINPSKEIFLKTKKIFSKYLDTTDLNYNLLTTWTLGTYFHNQFETYPLLLLMARKGSGKTRTLKLTSSLSCGGDGSISTSITETHLFRHKAGAVFFDEMESISSKDKGALRETMNAVYKKGNKIVRYRESSKEGVKGYQEENFYPFYPLGLANIYGFGDVLADRALQLIIKRSNKSQTKLIEDFSSNEEISDLRKELNALMAEIPKGIFSEWNKHVQDKKFSTELKDVFEAISKTKLNGRPLEIFFPLFIIADIFDVLPVLIKCSEDYMSQREGEEVDNIDDLLNDFMEKSSYPGYIKSSTILSDFKSSLEEPEDWMNSKWFGRALKRLDLIAHKRMVNGRVQIKINNTTNTTNSLNSTNTTNTTTNTKVELVELVDKKELVEEIPVFLPREIKNENKTT